MQRGPRRRRTQPGITQKIMDAGRAAAKTFDAIINPARFDEHAARAAGDIRSGLGSMNRESAIYQRYMKGFVEEGKEIGKDPGAVTDFYDWVQNRTRNEGMGRLVSEEAQPMFDAIRKTVRGVEDRLKALDKHADLNFLQDYFPQMWEREGYARTVFTKERKYATFADGIRAGLTPKYMDPIEAMTHYVEQMNKYIATQEAIEAAKGRGDIRYFASKPPEGWAKIDRLSRGEMSAYAPEGFARVWNRHLSVQKQGRIGDAIRAFQRITNASTGFHLGLSGFHAFNIAGETLINGLAEAVGAALRMAICLVQARHSQARRSNGPPTSARVSRWHRSIWARPMAAPRCGRSWTSPRTPTCGSLARGAPRTSIGSPSDPSWTGGRTARAPRRPSWG